MLDQRPQDIQLPTMGDGVQQTSERNQETTKNERGKNIFTCLEWRLFAEISIY